MKTSKKNTKPKKRINIIHENPVTEVLESYLDQVVPKGASETQIAETSQAFKAGAIVMHEIMMRSSDVPNERVALRNLDKIHAELALFGQEIDSAILYPEAANATKN